MKMQIDNYIRIVLFLFNRNTKDPIETLVNVTSKRWDSVTSRLAVLQNRLKNIRNSLNLSEISSSIRTTLPPSKVPTNIVIKSDPSYPAPRYILAFVKALAEKNSVTAKTHVHSSVSHVSDSLKDFLLMNDGEPRSKFKFSVTFVWAAVGRHAMLSVTPGKEIRGAVDIARFFTRQCSDIPYDNLTAGEIALMDMQLDHCGRLAYSKSAKEEMESMATMASALKNHKWLSGKNFSAVDILVWSHITSTNSKTPSEMSDWLKRIKLQKILQI